MKHAAEEIKHRAEDAVHKVGVTGLGRQAGVRAGARAGGRTGRMGACGCAIGGGPPPPLIGSAIWMLIEGQLKVWDGARL